MQRLEFSLETLDFIVRNLVLMSSNDNGITREFEDQVRLGAFIEPNPAV